MQINMGITSTFKHTQKEKSFKYSMRCKWIEPLKTVLEYGYNTKLSFHVWFMISVMNQAWKQKITIIKEQSKIFYSPVITPK